MSEEAQVTITLRPYRPSDDAPFLYSSWRNALWYSESRDDKLSGFFYSAASKEIKRLLGLESIRVRIACKSDEPGFIVGYSVALGAHLFWVYVKSDYREQGIARLLTQGFSTVSPPETKPGKAIVNDKELRIRHEKSEEA